MNQALVNRTIKTSLKPGKSLSRKLADMTEEQIAEDYSTELKRNSLGVLGKVLEIHIRETYGNVEIFKDKFPEYFV